MPVRTVSAAPTTGIVAAVFAVRQASGARDRAPTAIARPSSALSREVTRSTREPRLIRYDLKKSFQDVGEGQASLPLSVIPANAFVAAALSGRNPEQADDGGDSVGQFMAAGGAEL